MGQARSLYQPWRSLRRSGTGRSASALLKVSRTNFRSPRSSSMISVYSMKPLLSRADSRIKQRALSSALSQKQLQAL